MDSAPRAQTKIISVEGLIASGKSTFLDILKTKCPNFFYCGGTGVTFPEI